MKAIQNLPTILHGICILPVASSLLSSVPASRRSVIGKIAFNSFSTFQTKLSSAVPQQDTAESRTTESTTFINPSIAAKSPRDLEWWTDDCDQVMDVLDSAGGERFVAFHDEDTSIKAEDNVDSKPLKNVEVETMNWLHVTNSIPKRRVQYEMRFIKQDDMMAGVVRFGVDCEGPSSHVHGGAMASVADAISATVLYQVTLNRSSDDTPGRWGYTTRLDCNYREMLPVNQPVRVEAKVTQLKKRKAVIEWNISSMSELDKKGELVRYAFGSTDFLLPRE